MYDSVQIGRVWTECMMVYRMEECAQNVCSVQNGRVWTE